MRFTKAILASALLIIDLTPALAGCPSDVANIESVIRSTSWQDAEAMVRKLENSIACEPWEKAKAQALLSIKLVSEAKKIDPAVKDARAAALVENAAKLHADWRALELQGRIRRDAGKYLDAAESFQEAINLIAYSDGEAGSNPAGAGKNEASKPERVNLAKEADEAKYLAADGPNGTLVVSADRDGNPGGALSEAVDRGAVGIRVPAPILFEYDSANLTTIGTDAAQQMVDFLRQRGPKSITVVGHTDHVGSEAYNLDLSKRRAATIAALLRDKGITARITAVGKGFSEPWQVSEGATFGQAEIDKLNRRVEFNWN